MCIKQLTFYRRRHATMEVIRANVNKQVDTFAKEAPEHATEIVLALLEVTDEDCRIRSCAVAGSSAVSSTRFVFSSALC